MTKYIMKCIFTHLIDLTCDSKCAICFTWNSIVEYCCQILIMDAAFEKCICVNDFEKVAAEHLTANARCYFNCGATDEQTLQENCTAFKKWRFQPRVLRDVSKVDTTTTVLGDKISFPICVSPTAMNKMASSGGEADVAKAAASLNTGFTLGTWATTSIEEVNKLMPSALKLFQIYVLKDRELIKSLVERAEKNGFKAIVVTVDGPVFGRVYQVKRFKFTPPPDLVFKNFDGIDIPSAKQITGLHGGDLGKYVESLMDPSLLWKDIDWLKSITNLPIVVKGILTVEMALEAVSHGVDGIIVSNHGARLLDGVLPTINALPQVIRAVQGRCEVYLDSGIRNGGDVAKAIALGAKAVFVGRPIIWGLACGGEAGARKVLEILRDEFEVTMKLLGIRSIAELQMVPNLVIHDSTISAQL